MASFRACFLLATLFASSASFTPASSSTLGVTQSTTTALFQTQDNNNEESSSSGSISSRRNVVSTLGLASASGVLSAILAGPNVNAALAAEDSSFAEIAARANKISQDIEQSTPVSEVRKTDKTMYDFSLPIEGKAVPMKDILRQSFDGENAKVKAVLVVNIKQDDPVARKDIPELISLVTKYVIYCLLFVLLLFACFLNKTGPILLYHIGFILLSNLCFFHYSWFYQNTKNHHTHHYSY